jgi:putative membrane protein
MFNMTRTQMTSTVVAAAAIAGLVGVASAQNDVWAASPPSPAHPIPPIILPPLVIPPVRTKLNGDDAMFLKKAAASGAAEVENAKLASSKTTNDTVNQFAQKLIWVHTAANDQIQQLAKAYNVQVPANPIEADRREHERLSKLNGPEFDAIYVLDEIKDHQAALDLCRKESTAGQAPALKKFATTILPILQQHLQWAYDVLKTTAPAPRPRV